MKVNVGTTNPSKIEAVKETLSLYEMFKDCTVESKNVTSSITEQPLSLEETIRGAMNRAINAYENCNYSFGIESGLISVPHTKTGYMDVTVCAIYDGTRCHLGLSSAFEYPPIITQKVLTKCIDISQAFYETGMTQNPKIGFAEGVIGQLTKGRLNRKEYTKQAILTAMIHLDNPNLYQ